MKQPEPAAPMHRADTILLLSGGLDSTTLLYDLRRSGMIVMCLLVDYGQRHVQELTFAKAHCHRLGAIYTTMRIPMLGINEVSWVVPNRNAILISLAVSEAIRTWTTSVHIGCNADDAEGFPDCSLDFIAAMNAANHAAQVDVEVLAPYIRKRKREIASTAKDLGVPPHEIWTCYRGGATPCGECPACLKLKAALA